MNRYWAGIRGVMALAAAGLLSGCVLAPAGTKQEQAKLATAGRPYERPVEQRQLPELPSPATWQDVLHRAFLANGDLEGAYFDWKAAVTRIDMAAAYPNSNVQFGYQYMFSKESMKAWDRTTLSVGFDPAMPLKWPGKVAQAGKVALEEARTAGYRFETAKFLLQKQVLSSYFDLALMEEKIRIQRSNVALLKMLSETAANRVQAGGPQQDMLKAQIEYRLAENNLANMESQARSMRAMLNGMLARPADSPLVLPAKLPSPRPLAADDARLLAVATDRNPELAGLARQVAGRRDALELARMAYIPDFSPDFSVTGSVSKMVGTMVMLPTNIPMIEGQIKEARAMLRSTEAMARQARNDKGAAFVAALYAMRNAEREAELFQSQILPAAEQALNSSRQSYVTGNVGFADLIDSQRTLLDVRQLIADARIQRENRLVEIEALTGVDIETLARPATRPAPTTQPTPATQSARGTEVR